MSDTTAGQEPLPIRVVAGSPTDEETAAVAVVISRLLLERAASAAALPEAPAASAWDRSTRALRRPWPAAGDWSRS